MWKVIKADELYHHGIKGMKWGVRRFQNRDGSLTNAGVKRYGEHTTGTKLTFKQYKHQKREKREEYKNKHPYAATSEANRYAIGEIGKKYGHGRVSELRKSHWIRTGLAIVGAHAALSIASGALQLHAMGGKNFVQESDLRDASAAMFGEMASMMRGM